MSYNILDFGAKNDGVTNNATAIQAAIDCCHQNGGGMVLVPSGQFLTGTIWLKSHVELHLSHGAVLLASGNMQDYNAVDAYPQNFSYPEEEWVGKHLIIALGCENVAITGSGIIDGSGHLFYDKPEKHWRFLWADGLSLSKDKQALRPGQLICFVECTHVRVQDFRIQNATCWCCFFHGCDYVQVRGVRIFNDSTYANTDGIDIDCWRFVTVSDCIIDTGDDAIAIRGNARPLNRKDLPCAHITVTNCVLGSSSSAFRIGVGDQKIEHLRISNITVTRAATAFNLLTNYFPQCYTPLSNITFSNISLTNVGRAFEMAASAEGPIIHITFENISCECFAGAWITSYGGKHIRALHLENFRIAVKDCGELSASEAQERGTCVLRVGGITDSTLNSVRIDGCEDTHIPWDNAFVATDCDLSCERCHFPTLS